MERSKLITQFEIPQYLREIEVSKKQRPKYYYWDGQTIRGRNKKLLQKYINTEFKYNIILNNGNVLPQWLKYPYFIVGFRRNKAVAIYGHKVNGKWKHTSHFFPLSVKLTEKQSKEAVVWYLFNIETKERVLANETKAGKPKRIIIKGQDMYSGVLNEFTRAKIVSALKKDYKNKILRGILKHIEMEFIISNYFPVRIELEIIDTIRNYYDRTKSGDGIRWDVGNRAYPYLKTFVDFLVENDVLPDDDRLHVSGEGYYFTPCDKHEDRKLIFRIYKK